MKKTLTLVMAAALLVGLVGAGYAAWFSDVGTASANTFTAGTLDLALSNSGSGYEDNVTATWQSPEDWAPSETVASTLYFTNKGNINILSMAMDFTVVSRDGKGDGSHLDDQIIVSSWEECFNDDCQSFLSEVQGWVGDGEAPLTLAELDACTDFLGSGAPGPVTQDNVSGDGVLMEGGNKKDYELKLEFQFAEDAGDEYQGDTCVLDIEFDARQNFAWFGDLTNGAWDGEW